MDNADSFKFWENDIRTIDMPKMPADPLIGIVHSAIDPITGAQAAQHYAETQPREARNKILIHAKNELNTVLFSSDYRGGSIVATMEHNFGSLSAYQNYDMRGVMQELHTNSKVRIAGRLAYFMHVSYNIEETDAWRPILSLYLDGGTFIHRSGEADRLVAVPNYLIVPVTSVIDYTLKIEGEQ